MPRPPPSSPAAGRRCLQLPADLDPRHLAVALKRQERVQKRADCLAKDAHESRTESGSNFGSGESEGNPDDIMVNFQDEDATEDSDVMTKSQSIKLEFDHSDVEFWLTQIEMHMATAGIKRQWTKRLVLDMNLPQSVKAQMKDILRKDKDEVGDEP